MNPYTTPTTLPGGLVATVTRVAVHKPGQSADHGEGVTHVAIEDEGGGPFLVLEQPVPIDTREAGIAIDPDDLAAVAIVARALMAQPGLHDSEPAATRENHSEQALDMVGNHQLLAHLAADLLDGDRWAHAVPNEVRQAAAQALKGGAL